MSAPTRSSVWKALEADQRRLGRLHLRQLFSKDPARSKFFLADAAGWRMDYAKQRIDEVALRHLLELARYCGLEGKRDRMLSGERVNATEGRAAMHVALRAPKDVAILIDGVDVVPEVHRTLDRMAALARAIRRGEWKGYGGRPIRNIINVGIGGSHLGPQVAYEALRHYSDRSLRFRFVSNGDGANLLEAISGLSPDETLFIIASKSFTTVETLENARSAREWLLGSAPSLKAIQPHCVAITADKKRANAFGVLGEQIFPFPTWVGGRYSVDSAIGLSTMIAVGPEAFSEMLSGFRAMDEHFRTAPLASNVPVLHGLLAIWNSNFFKSETSAVLPYAYYLKRLPAYLQQLVMESNGKSVCADGRRANYPTSPIVWGEPGTNCQHSFFQLLHQGTHQVPCDFIAFANALEPLGRHHDLLLANAFAQTEALAFGSRTAGRRSNDAGSSLVARSKQLEGNHPSTLLLAEELTPAALGSLIALYEHSVFTQAAIWDINPFDQWGVDLGKRLAGKISREIAIARGRIAHDSSTNATIRWVRAHRTLQGNAASNPKGSTLVLYLGCRPGEAWVSSSREPVRFNIGRSLTPAGLVKRLKQLLPDWPSRRVSIGLPACVVLGEIAGPPQNLGEGWVGFDFNAAFGCPVRVSNDAVMIAQGQHRKGRMLFLHLSAEPSVVAVSDQSTEIVETWRLPFREGMLEAALACAGKGSQARAEWEARVCAAIEHLAQTLHPDDIVIGGPEAKYLRDLPRDTRYASDRFVLAGGLRLWESADM